MEKGKKKQDKTTMEIREQELTRYILPLREGGSLPGLAEADDGFRYAVKFKGAGHGTKGVISELIGGLIAKALKFNVPEYVLLHLNNLFGITEPDIEVQELLRKSEGLNLGLHFLDGAYTFEPTVNNTDAMFASKLVWLDAFLTNIDRTRLNPNMMIWNGDVWLIDHGASLYFHHSDRDPEEAAKDPFPYIKNHIMLPYASKLEEADRLMRQAITPRTLNKIVDLIPDEWLSPMPDEADVSTPPLSVNEEKGLKEKRTKEIEKKREVYRRFLINRLADTKPFVRQAIEERKKLGYGDS